MLTLTLFSSHLPIATSTHVVGKVQYSTVEYSSTYRHPLQVTTPPSTFPLPRSALLPAALACIHATPTPIPLFPTTGKSRTKRISPLISCALLHRTSVLHRTAYCTPSVSTLRFLKKKSQTGTLLHLLPIINLLLKLHYKDVA